MSPHPQINAKTILDKTKSTLASPANAGPEALPAEEEPDRTFFECEEETEEADANDDSDQ